MMRLSRLCHNYGCLEWLAIMHDGKLVGELLIQTQYIVERKVDIVVNKQMGSQQMNMSMPPQSTTVIVEQQPMMMQ